MKHWRALVSYALVLGLIFGGMFVAGCRDTVLPDPDACVPECTDRECGDDGCGGSCGECGGEETCEDGLCVGCVPDCTGRECGGDGCGGSCGDCDAGETCQDGLCVAGSNEVMPLDIGNQWEFSLDVMGMEATLTYEATGTEPVGGITATRIEGGCTGNPLLCSSMEGYYWLAANEGDGLYSYGDSRFGDYDPPNLMCSTTFNVGDTWQTTDDEGNVVEWEVVSTTETVTVPAGTFTDCIHYRATSGATEERWYHIGAGNLKTLSDGTILIELTDYSYEGGCVPDCTGRECGDDGCGGSCGECTPGETCEDGVCVAGADEVMPLGIGNQWEFLLGVMGMEATLTYEATGTEPAGGITATRIDGACTGNPLLCSSMEGYYWLAANQQGGLYSYGDSRFGEYDPPNLMCSTTFNVGDTWQTTDDEGGAVEWEVVSTTETVTVPAGTFTDCIHYHATAGATEERWYHIGAGNVKTLSDGSILIELTSHSYP